MTSAARRTAAPTAPQPPSDLIVDLARSTARFKAALHQMGCPGFQARSAQPSGVTGWLRKAVGGAPTRRDLEMEALTARRERAEERLRAIEERIAELRADERDIIEKQGRLLGFSVMAVVRRTLFPGALDRLYERQAALNEAVTALQMDAIQHRSERARAERERGELEARRQEARRQRCIEAARQVHRRFAGLVDGHMLVGAKQFLADLNAARDALDTFLDAAKAAHQAGRGRQFRAGLKGIHEAAPGLLRRVQIGLDKVAAGRPIDPRLLVGVARFVNRYQLEIEALVTGEALRGPSYGTTRSPARGLSGGR